MSCNFCHLKACIYGGLNPEEVIHTRTSQAVLNNDQDIPCMENKTEHSDKERIWRPSSGVAQAGSSDVQALSMSIVHSQADIVPCLSTITDSAKEPSIKLLMAIWYEEFKLIIQWSKRVPVFKDMAMEDQFNMLKSSIVDISYLRLAFRCLSTSCPADHVYWSSDLLLSWDQSAALWSQTCVTKLTSLVSSLAALHLDLTQFSLLCVLLLTYPDSPQVRCRDAVYRLQCQVLDALRRYTAGKPGVSPAHHGLLLLKISSIRRLSCIALDRFRELWANKEIDLDPVVTDFVPLET